MYFWMQSGCRPRLQYTYVRWSREITVQTSSLLTLALHPLLITTFHWSICTIGTALWCGRTRCFAPRRLTFTWSECPNAADRDTTVIRCIRRALLSRACSFRYMREKKDQVAWNFPRMVTQPTLGQGSPSRLSGVFTCNISDCEKFPRFGLKK